MPERELVFGVLLSSLMMGSVIVWLSVARRLVEGQPLVAYQPGLRVPWTIADVLWLIVAWPILELAALRLAVGPEGVSEERFSAAALVAVTAAHLLWAVVAMVYLERRTGARAREFGFDTSRFADDVRLGAGTFLAAAPLVYGIQFLVSRVWTPLEHPLAKLVTDEPNVGLLLLASASAVVVAPLSEELLFRVVLQGWLERSLRPLRRRGKFWSKAHRALPVVTSSLLFAAMHQGSDRVALFVLALFLGVLYRQTHRIFPSLVLHMCVNALAVAALWLGLG